jgi:hypothetical protein
MGPTVTYRRNATKRNTSLPTVGGFNTPRRLQKYVLQRFYLGKTPISSLDYLKSRKTPCRLIVVLLSRVSLFQSRNGWLYIGWLPYAFKAPYSRTDTTDNLSPIKSISNFFWILNVTALKTLCRTMWHSKSENGNSTSRFDGR